MVTHEGDRKVLAALAAHGADLTKPAHVLHFLYFPTRAGAEAAAAELRGAGFENPQVRASAKTSLFKRLLGKGEFMCLAEGHSVPSEANVFAATDRMNALAARLGGNYDGWEASVER